MLSFLDLAVFIVVVLSSILAMKRGFYRTLFAILPWVMSGVVAYSLYPFAFPFIKPYVNQIETASALAIAAVFLGALAIITFTTVILSGVVLDEKVGARNGALGLVYGAMRGMLIAIIAFSFYNWLVPDPDQPVWMSNSVTKPILLSGSKALREYTPDNLDSVIAKIMEKLAAPASEASVAETKPDKTEPEPTVGGLTTPPMPSVSTVETKPNNVPSEPTVATSPSGQTANQLPAGVNIEKTPSGSRPAPTPTTSATTPTEVKPDKVPPEPMGATAPNSQTTEPLLPSVNIEKTPLGSAPVPSPATSATAPTEAKSDKAPSESTIVAPLTVQSPNTPPTEATPDKTTPEPKAASTTPTPAASPIEATQQGGRTETAPKTNATAPSVKSWLFR